MTSITLTGVVEQINKQKHKRKKKKKTSDCITVFCFFLSVSLSVFFFSVYVVCFMCIYGPQCLK